MSKVKAPPKNGAFLTLCALITGHACEAISDYGLSIWTVNTTKVPRTSHGSSLLDGPAEDRGIEPLRLLPAVQRFADVPSTHTGSVLRILARDHKILLTLRARFCDRQYKGEIFGRNTSRNGKVEVVPMA